MDWKLAQGLQHFCRALCPVLQKVTKFHCASIPLLLKNLILLTCNRLDTVGINTFRGSDAAADEAIQVT